MKITEDEVTGQSLFDGKSLTEFDDRQLLKLMASCLSKYLHCENYEADYIEDYGLQPNDPEFQKIRTRTTKSWNVLMFVKHFVEDLK